ncbi:hypothetical protein C923_01329 [Plasmodium falciparum UGT5.1]|uniref:Surface antigen n=1 Tax=Plasmodium falciparum UGT5.1 TaxID=1237627 RepID=W7K274_PLAFA|nr:hypothetical protein C923_01329 [Plasmodium falciparum UGT5.1]
MDKFATLHTDVQSDAIPTCICEKSIADKAEKFCLNCGKNMGAIAPWWGLVCGVGYAGWSHYVATTVAEAATNAGMKVVINVLKTLGAEKLIPEICEKISSTGNYANIINFTSIISTEFEASCAVMSSTGANQAMDTSMCMIVQKGSTGGYTVEKVVSKALETILDKAPGAAEFTEIAEAANDHSFNYGNNLIIIMN